MPHDLKKATDDSLKKLSNGALNLSNFETMRDYWPQEIKNIAPYINYVIRVNESMVVDMFETAR